MKKSKTGFLLPFVGGILLILAGVAFLLDNLGITALNWEMLVGPMFAIGGLIFLLVFVQNTHEWWALIPGFILIGIGLTVFMGQTMGAIGDRLGGTIFLGFVALAFIMTYVTHPVNWWAIIPGGVSLTLAGVTLMPGEGALSGGVFFLGMALTFGLVYILPKPSGKLPWALYPAGILFLVGLLVTLGATNLMDFVLPMALLIGGGYVIYRAVRK